MLPIRSKKKKDEGRKGRIKKGKAGKGRPERRKDIHKKINGRWWWWGSR
jgi:hypothetical protein